MPRKVGWRERGPPEQRRWQPHPWEGASEWVFAARAAAFPLRKQRGNSAFAKVQILLILLWFRKKKKQQTENIPGKLTAEHEFAARGGTVCWKIVSQLNCLKICFGLESEMEDAGRAF